MKKSPIVTLFLIAVILASCTSKKEISEPSVHPSDSVGDCETLWAIMNPQNEEKIKLIQEVLADKKELSSENIRFLESLIADFKRNPTSDTLLLTIEKPLYPIYRLKKNQIGVLGFMKSEDFEGSWEDYAREKVIVEDNYAYQSVDSVGKLCYFTEEFTTLYMDHPPKFYWYSLNKRSSSTFRNLAYMGDDCLSYFQYDFDLSKEDEKENILFGTKYALDLEFKSFPDIDQKFKKQYTEGCIDCVSNYPDQKTFAKVKGTSNIYFTYADHFPINNKMEKPSRSLVMKLANGTLITLWSIELDLAGCGCH